MVSAEAKAGAPTFGRQRLPPVPQLAVATLVLVISGGIYVVAYLPERPPLVPSIGLSAAAAFLLLLNVAMLSRIREFDWDAFFLVARWTLLAYIVIGGMLECVFILDRTPRDLLLLLSAALLVYAVDIPLLLAFSVAQHQMPASTGPVETRSPVTGTPEP